jgi:hypothetical protein
MHNEFNHSELVQIALNCGIRKVGRGTPRKVIIEHLNNFQDIEARDPLLDMREQMSGFLKEVWENNLDIQKPPGRPCPECMMCTDLQIVACYSSNKDQIALWRPNHA